MIKRWEKESYGNMWEDKDGKFVLYEDYKVLEKDKQTADICAMKAVLLAEELEATIEKLDARFDSLNKAYCNIVFSC